VYHHYGGKVPDVQSRKRVCEPLRHENDALHALALGDNASRGELPVPPWVGGPPRLWSLVDMTRFNFLQFLAFIRRLDEEAAKCTAQNPADQVPEPKRKELVGIVRSLRDQCTEIGLLKQAYVFSLTINRINKGCSFELLGAQLVDLRIAVIQALSGQRFAFIPAARAEYFENRELFGKAVYKAFPSARADIKDAGNCLAADLYTAVVFHLMRVAEHGLRALAVKLRARVTHRGKSHPIEFATWDKVITSCNNQIEKARKLSPGPKKQKALSLYADLAQHCLYMKDIWRNSVSHTQSPYTEIEALSVMERVRDFMRLATQVL
jgi:hypothetical protein